MKGKKWIALATVAAMALSDAGLAAFAQGEEGAVSPSETVAPIEEVVYVATYLTLTANCWHRMRFRRCGAGRGDFHPNSGRRIPRLVSLRRNGRLDRGCAVHLW